MPEGSAPLARDGLIKIWIPGDPQPFPKKEMAVVNGKPMLFDRDYRTRMIPGSRKIQKYDRGYKQRWIDHVTNTVDNYMFRHNLKPFPKNHPVALGLLFFLPKAASCELDYPSQAPDRDNLDYAVWNALKRTPSKIRSGVRVQGKYRNGVLFYDDDQIIWGLFPCGKLWATEQQPPGVLLTACSALDIREEIERFAVRPQLELIGREGWQ